MFDFFKKKKPEAVEKTVQEIAPTAEKKGGWFAKLKDGLNQSSSKLVSGISAIINDRKLDDETLEELEDLLITCDFGVHTASNLINKLRKDKFNKDITIEEVKEFLADEITQILEPVTSPLQLSEGLNVMLMVGVNGNGKTTTIGKITNQMQKNNKKVMMAACDTFRAAAVEQLAVWAERNKCGFIRGEEGADPASVAYKAIEQAKAENADLLVIDTAGRLHNKKNLMEELAKIVRVIKKHDENYPQNTILVLDATTGQNAFNQVETFKELVNINGLIITKLDGSAKGGVVVGIAEKYKLNIHAIGVGEGMNDLKDFQAKDFAFNLVDL